MENPNYGLPKIGYLFHHPNLDHPTEPFRLDIYISSTPTEKHFDVQHASFFVKTKDAKPRTMTVSHPWGFEKSAHLCVGLVAMVDRHGIKKEAFTFGGKLTIVTKETQSICTLVSRSPILDINAGSPTKKLFIDEVEIILAKYRASFLISEDFEKMLCAPNPFTLYLACLIEIITKLEDFPHKNETYLNLLIHLHSQYHRLEDAGLIKGAPLSLDQIFQVH